MRLSTKWVAIAALVILSGVSAATSPATASDGVPVKTEVTALDEMLRDSKGRLQSWTSVPELVVLTSVMQYHAADSQEYVATAEVMDEKDTQSLISDLTLALRQLTHNAVEEFAVIRYETVAAGSTAAIVRPKQIVVGRFQGLTDMAHTIGFGGRTTRRGEIVGAAILLDSEFDRTSDKRRLSRTHELGHALGFNHVKSRVSIMNERIGSEVTDLDRQIGLLAFQHPNVLSDE